MLAPPFIINGGFGPSAPPPPATALVSLIPLVQVVTHLSFFCVHFRLVIFMVFHVFDLSAALQEGVVHPVMETDHLPEKPACVQWTRTTAHGCVKEIFDPRVERPSFPECLSNKLSRHRKGFRLSRASAQSESFDSDCSHLGSVQVELESTWCCRKKASAYEVHVLARHKSRSSNASNIRSPAAVRRCAWPGENAAGRGRLVRTYLS